MAETTVFLPYSTKRNWVRKYPHAAPAMDLNKEGETVVYLNWRPFPNALGYVPEGTSRRERGNDDDDLTYPQLKRSKISHRKKRKCGMEETQTALLTNAERDVLHVEIYEYFRWLKDALGEMEAKNAGRKVLGNACATSESMVDALRAMESTFRVISTNVSDGTNDNNGAAATATTSSAAVTTPFLERALGEELSRKVEKTTLRGGSHKREQGEFEDYFMRLMEFRERNGHSNGEIFWMLIFESILLAFCSGQIS